MPRARNIDSGVPPETAELLATLRRRLSGEVRFDPGGRALYTTDASNYRQVPIGVVTPRDTADLETALTIARDTDTPVLMRGGGTSLAGQTCNIALVLDTSRHLNRILSLDPERRRAWVEPGVICDQLRNAAEEHGLTFGPDPSTHTHCTLGGMVGNNSCGAHSVMAGKTVDNIESLEILTYDGLRMTVGPTSEQELQRLIRAGGRRGEIYARLCDLRDRYADRIRREFPDIRRRVSGYNLDALLPENGFNVAAALIGSEGTCAVTLAAEARLIPSPPHRVLVVLGYEDICQAGDRSPPVLATGALALEGLDEQIVGDMRKKGMGLKALEGLPDGNGWLLAEFGGDSLEEATHQARRAMDQERDHCVDSRLYTDPAEANLVWSVRKSGAAATNALPGEPETYPGWEDAAVDPEQVGDYLRDYRQLLERYGYRSSLYGHFGDGCIHGRVTFDLASTEGVAQWRRFTEEAADLVVSYGGSLSGEHGDGQARAELWPRMFSEDMLKAFDEFKAIWDPRHRLNPHKLVDPYRLDENLRTGPDYDPIEPEPLHFSFHKDQGSFAMAANRCVGVGKCRSQAGGIMCPSYRGTLDEQHSTRGRARLLFEMLQGEPVADGWASESVHQALDMCLACKACKHECPVQVDMATYKAEFMAHYYEHHRRPRQAWTFGRIHEWSRLAGQAPRLFNGLTALPGINRLVKKITGMAPERSLPRFSTRPYTRSYQSPQARDGQRPAVVLWPDTFNNFLHAQTPSAAQSVLEQLGFDVRLPGSPVCCGRPLYDYGWLGPARKRLEHTLATLQPAMDEGLPVVGLEPSCLSVFRDELLNLLPDDDRARWLADNTWLLPDFLANQQGLALPRLEGEVLLHGHCHQAAGAGLDGSRELLEAMGLRVTTPDSGCCGMAGGFGFEADKYAVSQRIGESVLLPAVREAGVNTWIVSDGFSCREQIQRGTGRRALHTAELLELALART
ncbi:MAG: FAD-binding and (Fe-S)-binding domain-containing protein [Marinobacter sp.]|uniref:FAD-binding and (Fe-S)-binding domain-containing protein n=1 Tax=Marinobacter sp. TaxID=50741 RepID=UPI00299EB0FA|nr:FAD-binding and (Fe-S)-binding domain-containing protein [Marinobacter sp.]MDX1634260.1 FAD-binding and (Fe-S)-binding domain-containing protein [Marinobacter sp.]